MCTYIQVDDVQFENETATQITITAAIAVTIAIKIQLSPKSAEGEDDRVRT